MYVSLPEISKLEIVRTNRPSFTHVINPFNAKPGSEHDIAQSTTFRSITIAKRCTPDIPVEILCAVYPEDKNVVPAEFKCVDTLSMSISDLVESDLNIKLPLLFDLLNIGAESSMGNPDDEYLIYTNIDIGLMPFFYQTVSDIVQKGFDAIVINRRTVDQAWGETDNFGLMFSDIGKKHPGSDCFIIKKSLVKQFVRSECCLGVITVMKSLMINMAAVAEKMVIVADAHATFHIGDDRRWSNPRFKPYANHNRSEAQRIAKELLAFSPEYKEKLQEYAIQKNEGMLLKMLGLESTISTRMIDRLNRKLLSIFKPLLKKLRSLYIHNKNFIKSAIHKLLRKTGYELTKIDGKELLVSVAPRKSKTDKSRSNNLINIDDANSVDPRYLSYLINTSPVVIIGDPSKGRGNPLFSYGPDSHHPFTFAAKVAKNKPEQERYNIIYSILEKYYELVAPATAGDLAGVSKTSSLFNYPSSAFIMPWDKFTPEEQQERLKKFTIRENAPYDTDANIKHGWTWVGPCHNKKCTIEATRLTKLLKSVLTDGYQRHDGGDGDIRAIILINEANDWVWLSTGGQHRASVLSALEHDSFPIRVHNAIRREEAQHWPNVVNGLYSLEDALKVFDNIFTANFSHVTSNWDSFIASYK